MTTDYPLTVGVANADAYGTNGVIKFQINSGPWQNYTASGISVSPADTVRVQAFAVDPTAYRDSYQASEFYYAVASSFSGNTSAIYDNVTGGPNLVYSLTEDDTFLSHGTPELDLGDGTTVTAGEANTLKFLAGNFSGVLPGEEFVVGELLYHNGTTFDNSHATGANLNLDIVFTAPVATESIVIDLDLINTENTSDPDASADYVRLSNVNATYSMTIDGTDYDLTLQFGTTDANGFSSTNQFHVYEGATARGEIRGTMTLAD